MSSNLVDDENTKTAQPKPSQVPIHIGKTPVSDSKDMSRIDSATQPSYLQHLNVSLRLEVWALEHPMAIHILGNLNMATVVREACEYVLQQLYGSPGATTTAALPSPTPTATTTAAAMPDVRSVTIILRDMDGVAFTRGTERDDAHKEIHISLNHVARYGLKGSLRELRGVVYHEMVHAWQWDGLGTTPGGLIEGIADFVRLRSGLAPDHWRRQKGNPEKPKQEKGGDDDSDISDFDPDSVKWDSGYETTAYFLDWLEDRFGKGSVARMNAHMRKHKWDSQEFFKFCFSASVEDLWSEYCKS